MRLVTFNLQHGRRHDDRHVDVARFARAVAALDADVLALQEVDRGQLRSHRADLTNVTFTTTAPPADTTAPTVPGTPTASGITKTGATLTWTPSTDAGSGVAAYEVLRVVGTTQTLVASPTTPSTVLTGLTADTAYSYVVRAVDAAGNTSAASAPVTFRTLGDTPAGTCAVTYTPNSWNTGFTTSIKITNTGTAPLTWALKFSFSAGQLLSSGWSADWSQTGSTISATGLSWNATLAPGASTEIGFQGTHTGSNPTPTVFTVNGTTCA